MAAKPVPSQPFIILTPRLVLIPHPLAIDSRAYRAFHASLFTQKRFCEMAFGPDFPVKTHFSDEEARDLVDKSVQLDWQTRDMGSFAVALRAPLQGTSLLSKEPAGGAPFYVLRGQECVDPLSRETEFWDALEWAGYALVRDGSTRLPAREADDAPFPEWRDFVEVGYGFAEPRWGKGYASEVGRAVVAWAERDHGVRRFVAATDKFNAGSGRVLEKLGFTTVTGTPYWKDERAVEWERPAASQPP